MAVDRVAVMEAMASLARNATEDVPVAMTLKRLCDATADGLGLSLVGVVLVEPGRHRSVVTNGPPVQHLQVLLELLRDGPCADAARSGTIIQVTGPELDRRWGELGRGGATAGVRRVVALPMTSRGACWGVLHLCDHQAGPWPVDVLAAARCMADTATASVVLASDREAARLAQAQLVHQCTHDVVTRPRLKALVP